jgi:hypothetical protein
MRESLFISSLCSLLLFPLMAMQLHAQSREWHSGGRGVRFTENRGQIVDGQGVPHPEVRFVAAASNMRLFFMKDRISYLFTRPASGRKEYPTLLRQEEPVDPPQELDLHRADLQLLGVREEATIVAEERTADVTSYYYPHSPDGITGVPSFRQLVYAGIWPEIDMVVHGSSTGLKYDFVVHPGGRINNIRMRYSGADGVELTGSGRLRITTSLGTLEEHEPVVYQSSTKGDAIADTLKASYQLHDGEITFTVGSYDSSRTLVIDPAVEWSTYFGGSGSGDDGNAIATDRYGNVLIAGTTGSASSTFPTKNGFQKVLAGNDDGFVAKFNSIGDLLWSTYYGGKSFDRFNSVATDTTGHVVVCGSTESNDFPVSSDAFQKMNPGFSNATLVRFDSNGVRLWGTLIGGEMEDYAYAVASTPEGEIAVAGSATSLTFPVTAEAFQSRLKGRSDTFIVRFTSGGKLLWSTYYGGIDNESAYGVAFDKWDNVLVCGRTFSDDFPVLIDARQPTKVGISTAFTVKLESNGYRRWATFIGGTGNSPTETGATAIATDDKADVIVAGWTNDDSYTSTDNSFQPHIHGMTDGFLIKLDSIGQRDWATFVGGKQNDTILAITIDQHSSIHLTGSTTSGDFPTTIGTKNYPFGSPLAAFIASFDSSGRMTWGAFHGGSDSNRATGIAADTNSALIIAGSTTSTDFPITTNPFQSMLQLPRNAFITKFGCSIPPAIRQSSTQSFCRGDSAILTAYKGTFYRWSTNETTQSITVRESGIYNYLWIDKYGCATRSGDIRVIVHELPLPVITGPTILCGDETITLSAQPGFNNYLWSTGATTEKITVSGPGAFWVTVYNVFGCEATSPIVQVVQKDRPNPSIAAPRDSIGCIGDSIQLSAAGNFNRYAWSTGETTPSIVIHNAGVYELRVWNDDGCDSAVRITIRGSKWQPSIRPLGPLAFCQGEQTTLASNASYTDYLWSTGERTSEITVSATGDYWLQATDANGCTMRSDPLHVTVHPLPPVPAITASATTLTSSTAPMYQWNRDRVPLPGETGQSLGLSQPGSYTVTITDSNGCRSTSLPYEHETETAAALHLGVYEAAPGERVTIALEMTASRNLWRRKITRFSAHLRFRASLLAPADRTLPIAAVGNNRIVTITGAVPPLAADGSGTLAKVDFTALLGDTIATPLTLEAIEWQEGTMETLDTLHGEFRLKGLCVQGSSRLIAVTGEPGLKPARPDPASGMTEIEYEVIEDGEMILFLVDAAGHTISLLHEQESPGRYVARFDASQLATGQYTCVLQTRTMRLHQTLRIIH